MMNNNENMEEKLRRIETKLDQCIAMNNETRIMCDRIMQKIMDMESDSEAITDNMSSIKGELKTEPKNVRIKRIRAQKELLNTKISEVIREKEKIKNSHAETENRENVKEFKEKMERLDKELANLQEELTECLEYQQKTTECRWHNI